MTTALLLLFTLFLVLGVPICLALILATAISILAFSDYSLVLIAQQLLTQSNSFPLMSIPLFVLAGAIMGRGGMSRRLIELATCLVGEIRGGMGIVAVLGCLFFACISGSTAATTAAIGTVLLPAILTSGFTRNEATALLSTAGSIGIIIPPSVPLILMGVIGGVSIGKLFIGGIIPGICIGIALMAVVHLSARIKGHRPSGEGFSGQRLRKAIVSAVPPLFTLVIILAAILLGIATATEAAILAVVWAFGISAFVYRELSIQDMRRVLIETVSITGVVVFCIGATAPFAWLLTVEEVPSRVAAIMLTLTTNPILLKLMLIALLLAVGTILDLTPAMIILVPILMPIGLDLGMDPVQFGIVTVMALGIGQSTPPVGIALFVACGVTKARMEAVVRPLVPYLFAMLLVLLLVAFWPTMTQALLP
ncbi:MAG: TRAP transporter large permease [Puniceicoccales bacterium]